MDYARTLIRLQEFDAGKSPEFSLAFTGKNKIFIDRIKKILNMNQQKNVKNEHVFLSMLVVLALFFATRETIANNFFPDKVTDYISLVFPDGFTKPSVQSDTLPKTKESITIIQKDDEKEVKVQMENGEIRKLEIDGKEIPAEEYNKYSDITQGIEGNHQFNWDKEYIEGIQPVFGDYDGDGKDEVFVFCQEEDSVFVVGLDPLGGKGVFLERFIHKMSFREGAREFSIFPSGVHDLNKDGYGEVVFSLVAGFAKTPRALCALDIRNDSLWMHERKYHLFQGDPMVIYANGEPYLFSTSYAPGNHPDTAGGVVPDTVHDFTLYGRDLQPRFPHLRFTEYSSGLYALPLKREGKWHVYLQHYRPSTHSTMALVLDLEGREVARWEPDFPMDALAQPYGGPEREQVLTFDFFN
ncbi:MAG TPA: hypothetical protein P5248_03825, partial [Bacteroidales bacterium]|nr:hypothetical protein [Bacteroidales bacterium]